MFLHALKNRGILGRGYHNVIHTLEGHRKTIGQAIERTNAHGGEATSTFADPQSASQTESEQG